MGGSLPLPTEVHKKKGTFQPCRHADRDEGELVIEEGYPSPSQQLKPGELEIWNEIRRIMEPSNIYTDADSYRLTRYCVAQNRFHEEGIDMPIYLWDQLRKLEDQLYLSIKERIILGVKKKTPDNAFDKFKK